MENKTQNQTTENQTVNTPATLIYERQYRKTTGKLVFVYQVEGTPEQKQAYLKSKGEFAKACQDDKGVIRFFTIRYVGKKVAFIQTSKGEFHPDTTEADKFASLVAQFGIDVAKEMMKQPSQD